VLKKALSRKTVNYLTETVDFIPGIPGGGGVRLEDTILITEDGNEFI